MVDRDDLVQRVLAVAAGRGDIDVVIRVSSPRGRDRADTLLDLDFELVGRGAPGLAIDEGWLATLGPRLMTLPMSGVESGNAGWPTCLVVLADGRKVCFTFAGPSRISELVEGRSDALHVRNYHVLLDKTGLAAELSKLLSTASDILLPESRLFEAHQRRFWFAAFHVPTCIARGDFWAAARHEAEMRSLLLDMLEWSTHVGRHSSLGIQHDIRRIAEWLRPERHTGLTVVPEADDSAGLLAALCGLVHCYADAATETARRLDFADLGFRPQVLDHIRTLLGHALPAVGPSARASVAPVDAVVVVDMQTGFLTGDDAVSNPAVVVGAVDSLLAAARASGAAVIHLRNSGPSGAPDEPGTSTWQLHRPPLPGEPVIDKAEDNAFIGTRLDDELRQRDVRRLAICGVMSEMCVAATARGALAHGYGVVLPHTAHATSDVPPGPGSSPLVPAEFAARAAEWSLGDTIEIIATPTDVSFTPIEHRAAGRTVRDAPGGSRGGQASGPRSR